jgi:hypothetical protein
MTVSELQEHMINRKKMLESRKSKKSTELRFIEPESHSSVRYSKLGVKTKGSWFGFEGLLPKETT